jgi:chromosome segregation ATPase
MSDPTQNPDRQFQLDVLGMLSSIHSDVASLQAGQSSLQADVTSLQAGQSSLQADVSSLQAGQSSLRTDLSELGSSVGDSIRQVAADQTRLRVEVMARIDRLQTTIELVREDARVNWATADTALTRVKNYREEIDHLTAIITAMERRHQTLATVVDGLRDRKPNGG